MDADPDDLTISMHRVVTVTGFALAITVVLFAIIKGFVDVHARERCLAEGGGWHCQDGHVYMLRVSFCACDQPELRR